MKSLLEFEDRPDRRHKFYGIVAMIGYVCSIWNWGYLLIMACPFLLLFAMELQAYKFNQKQTNNIK